MAQLEIATEFDALSRGDVAVGDEDHVCDRTAGEDDTANELADEVKGRVLVGDGHDDADGDEEDRGDSEGEEKAVPGEMDGVVFNSEDAYGEHDEEGKKVPWHWDVWVTRHEAVVNVEGRDRRRIAELRMRRMAVWLI